jgi:hypothetical protein
LVSGSNWRLAWVASLCAIGALRCTVEIAPLEAADASVGGSAGRDAGADADAAEAGAGGASGSDGGVDAPEDVADATDAPPDVVRIDGGPCQCNVPDCGTCPTTPTLEMVGDGYRIDATEVTVANYLDFLAARLPRRTTEPLLLERRLHAHLRLVAAADAR